jgi:hypothetical protein
MRVCMREKEANGTYQRAVPNIGPQRHNASTLPTRTLEETYEALLQSDRIIAAYAGERFNSTHARLHRAHTELAADTVVLNPMRLFGN